jgi:hypothetical protein
MLGTSKLTAKCTTKPLEHGQCSVAGRNSPGLPPPIHFFVFAFICEAQSIRRKSYMAARRKTYAIVRSSLCSVPRVPVVTDLVCW